MTQQAGGDGTENEMQRGVRGFSPTALRAARLRAGWGYGELAESSGVSPSTLSSWERGVSLPRPALLQRVVDALGISADELLRKNTRQTLQALRTARGWTVPDAAAAAGISTATLSRAERAEGRISPRTVLALATAYGLTVDDLEAAANLTRVERRRRRGL